MVPVFGMVYAGAALLAIADGALIVASFFIAERGSQSQGILGVHLAVSAVFLGLGVLLLGIRRHVAGIAAVPGSRAGEAAGELATHVNRLLVYLLAAGAFLCLLLCLTTYAILERIGQGSAVFG
jgi:hypothetical protein